MLFSRAASGSTDVAALSVSEIQIQFLKMQAGGERTKDGKTTIFFRIPFLVLLPSTRNDNIPGVLWILVRWPMGENGLRYQTLGSVCISNQPSHRWHLHLKEYMGVE